MARHGRHGRGVIVFGGSPKALEKLASAGSTMTGRITARYGPHRDAGE